jgi:chromosome segregation ATPase
MRSLPKKVIKDMKTHLRNQEDTVQKSQKECIRLRGERAFIEVELQTLKSKLEQLESSYVKFESSLQTEFQYEMSRHNNRQLIETGYHDKTTGELMQKIDKLKIDVKFKDTKIKHQEDVIKNYSNEISKLERSNTDVEVACELRKKNINRLEDVIKGCHEERRAIEEEVRLLNIFVEDLTIELNKRNDSIKVYRAENDVFNAQVALLEERDGICSTNLVSFRNNLLEAQAKCKKSQAECLVLETALNKVKNELVQSKNKFSHLKITANVEITLQASEVNKLKLLRLHYLFCLFF